MKSGARTRVSVASSFTRTWSDGPAVSLNGPPTPPPTTAAAGAATVVQDGRQEDTRDRADHQKARYGLVAEEHADDDREGDRQKTRGHHLAECRPRRDVDDPGVVRSLAVVHDPGVVAELVADLDDDSLRGPADGPDGERAEEVDEHRGQEGRDEDVDVGQVD